MIKDKVCFNGATDQPNCIPIEGQGLEFFVVQDFNGSTKMEASLFKGVIGLSVVPQSRFVSIVEYASLFNSEVKSIVSVWLGT